jgi:hypothetical protein
MYALKNENGHINAHRICTSNHRIKNACNTALRGADKPWFPRAEIEKIHPICTLKTHAARRRAAQIDIDFYCASNLHSNAADGLLHIQSAHPKGSITLAFLMCGLHVRIACADCMCGLHVRIACADCMCGLHVRIACVDCLCRLHVHCKQDRTSQTHIQTRTE